MVESQNELKASLKTSKKFQVVESEIAKSYKGDVSGIKSGDKNRSSSKSKVSRESSLKRNKAPKNVESNILTESVKKDKSMVQSKKLSKVEKDKTSNISTEPVKKENSAFDPLNNAMEPEYKGISKEPKGDDNGDASREPEPKKELEVSDFDKMMGNFGPNPYMDNIAKHVGKIF